VARGKTRTGGSRRHKTRANRRIRVQKKISRIEKFPLNSGKFPPIAAYHRGGRLQIAWRFAYHRRVCRLRAVESVARADESA